jgi:pyruvate dehydrogenase E2 component (dihydrolipoamide acetyltransferase)
MKVEVKIPQQGLTVDTVTLLDWSVAVGDTVAKNGIMGEMESEKATLELESPAAGRVAELIGIPGEEYVIGAVVAYVETEG